MSNSAPDTIDIAYTNDTGSEYTFNTLNPSISTTITGATGTVVFNYNSGPIFNVTAPASNWTANITNVPTTNNRVSNTAIIITQGATPYIPNVIQIAGVTQTIKWIDGNPPTGYANQTDVITLSMLRVGDNWTVLGSYINYG